MLADPYQRAAQVPTHVPPELVFDFDLYHPDGLDENGVEDIHALWKHVQDTYPKLFWTPQYGGHWVATRYAEIARIQLETDNFSSVEFAVPRGVMPSTIPNQLDPPEHGPVRRLLIPAFSPRALAPITAKARDIAIDIIEKLKPRGSCEFVSEFAGAMPIMALLNLIQLPQEDHGYLRGLAVDTAKVAGPKAAAARVKMEQYVRDRIRERQEQPRNDYISTLVHAEVEGRKLTSDEIFQICNLVIGGGLDTVVSMTSFACAFLARHPDARRTLREHPEMLDNAVEEIARRFGTSNLGRLVRRDLELGGVKLVQDEMIVGIFPLAGLDETMNPDPMRFDIFRERPRHLAFGSGVHVCVGATLARREIRIFLEEWLTRIPEFSLKPGTLPKVTSGVVNSAVELQLVWDTP